MTKDEALKMAVDVLQNYAQADSPVWRKALNACKEALEQPAQEPLGWLPATYKYNLMSNDDEYPIGMVYHSKRDEDDVAVYTHPHQCEECKNLKHDLEGYMNANKQLINKEWQGLTDDEIVKAFNLCDWMNEPITEFARAIQQALKDKNY